MDRPRCLVRGHIVTASFIAVLFLLCWCAGVSANEWAADEKRIRPLPISRPVIPEAPKKYDTAIDRFVAAEWVESGIKPARVCDDLDFVRRVYLDLAGIIPTVVQIEAFLEDGPDRRARLIDRLLDSNRYADHWAAFWGDLLLERSNIRGAERFAFRDYILDALTRNKPYDVWVREMLSATGTMQENPANAFMLRHGANRDEMTIVTTQVFLGMQLKCAQCHDHPYEGWRQDDFNGVRAFLDGTRVRRVQPVDEEALQRRPVFEVVQTGRRPKGKFLTGRASELGKGRAGLADLVTRRDNPYFARVAVNRLWDKLMGEGMVDPPDGFSITNPPSHPALLDWLAIEFVDSGYDLKHILRLICRSKTYQLEASGSRRMRGEDDGRRLFAEAKLRRMTAEQLADSIIVACGLSGRVRRRFQPAIEQPYPPRPGSFLEVFGCHDRNSIHERDTEATIPQALALLNGNFVNEAVRMHDGHPVRNWLEAGEARSRVVDRLFLHTLTREPTRKEHDTVLSYARTPQTWSDVHWALINTREFMFIH